MAMMLLWSPLAGGAGENAERIRLILDTDANNELDDQHAIAYTLFSGDTFAVRGITVNGTINGGGIEGHLEEAVRVVRLCERDGVIPVLPGANGSFLEIGPRVMEGDFDGSEAVDFIIKEAHADAGGRLVVIAVGKLTNVALALRKDPGIEDKIRLVWLGSNYPEPGEYNLVNDIPSMNYLLESDMEMEIVTVRYGKPTGTDAVRMSKAEALEQMPGLGPSIETPITGRHGGEFTRFGDYSADLFEHIEYYDCPPTRALFDMAAVAIVKNPEWATRRSIPAPIMVDEVWQERPDNPRKVILWEHFKSAAILEDFIKTLNRPTLVSR